MTTCTITRAVAAVHQMPDGGITRKIVVTLTFDTDLVDVEKAAIAECCAHAGSFMPVMPSSDLPLANPLIPSIRHPPIAYGVVTFPQPHVAQFELEGNDRVHSRYTDFFLIQVQLMLNKLEYTIVIPGLP